MQAFEVSGTIAPTGRLILDQPLQVSHPVRIVFADMGYWIALINPRCASRLSSSDAKLSGQKLISLRND